MGQIVAPDGTTNTGTPLLERNGKFWVEDLPVVSGTNLVTVTATDAAGNSSATALWVVKGDVSLTIAEVPESLLYLPTATVTGTVTGPTNLVWVNGIQAQVDVGNGGWIATNVPVPPGGSAVFTATAYPPEEAPSGGSSLGANVMTPSSCDTTLIEDKPPRVYIQHYELKYNSQVGAYDWLWHVMVADTAAWSWEENGGALISGTITEASGFPADTRFGFEAVSWPADFYPPSLPGTLVAISNVVTTLQPSCPRFEHCNIKGTASFYNADDGRIETAKYARTADSVMMLFTGGKELIGEESLHKLNVDLWSRDFQWRLGGGSSINLSNIAPGASAGVFGQVGPDGAAYQLLPNGKDVEITPKKEGVSNAGGDLAGHSKYQLVIFWDKDITDQTTNRVYVGQPVLLSCVLSPPDGAPAITNYEWTLPGNYIRGYDTSSTLGTNLPAKLTNQAVLFYWVDKLEKGTITCKVKAGGKEWSARTVFSVTKPTASWNGFSGNVFTIWGGALNFGDPGNNVSGMTFTLSNGDTLGLTNGFQFLSAQLGSVQVRFDGTNSSGDKRTVTLTGQGLDTAWPYTNFGTVLTGQTTDSPDVPLAPSSEISPLVYVSKITYTGSFNHYLFFQPDGGIPVALKRIDWSFSMQATNTGATTSADELAWPACNASVTARDVPVSGNPEWTNNVIYPTKTVTP